MSTTRKPFVVPTAYTLPWLSHSVWLFGYGPPPFTFLKWFEHSSVCTPYDAR